MMGKEEESIKNFFAGLSEERRPTPQDMWEKATDNSNTHGSQSRADQNPWNLPEDDDPTWNRNARERKVWFTKVSYNLSEQIL